MWDYLFYHFFYKPLLGEIKCEVSLGVNLSLRYYIVFAKYGVSLGEFDSDVSLEEFLSTHWSRLIKL